MRALIGCLIASVASAESLPPWFQAPANASVEVSAAETFGEANFPLAKQAEHVVRGHHWRASLALAGADAELDSKSTWGKVKEALTKKGWSVAAEFPATPWSATVTLKEKGREAWGSLWLFGGGDVRLELVEVAPLTRTLTLVAPQAKPEAVDAEKGDFPYLRPLEGAVFGASSREPRDFTVNLPGQTEAEVVATGTIEKTYSRPEALSDVEAFLVYRAALKAAGWVVTFESQALSQVGMTLIAHYGKSGRDVWASVELTGESLKFSVADLGQRDLAAQLRADCRVTLTGVLFDFDKATLRPESDSALARLKDALDANATKRFEVQGHTDAVGQDAYNQKLSENRAKAVVSWLTAHGAKSAQLQARGYGKGQPVATNETVEGRAKNRRVEVVCAK